MKICKHCKREIKTGGETRQYCNDKCKNDYGNAKRKSMPKEKKYCTRCGLVEITGINQKYCEPCYPLHLIEKNNEKYKGKECCTCGICGFKGYSLVSHLNDKHNISKDEYIEQYNKSLDDVILPSVRRSWADKLTGENNGAFNHGGAFSPYSKKFVKYENMTDEQKEEKINKLYENLSATLTDGTGRLPTQTKYWTDKGFTEADATEIIRDRQTTFSLDKCIEKYGEIDGLERWNKRQEKWLSNFKKQNFSQVSQKLFWQIYELIKTQYSQIFFAQINPKTLKLEEHKNYEYMLKLKKSYCKLDFFIKDINKAIEFDGDYWHGEKRGNKKRDEIRDNEIMKQGIQIFHVKERDYKNNPDKTITECLDFIYG